MMEQKNWFLIGVMVALQWVTATGYAQKSTEIDRIKEKNREAYRLKDVDPQRGLSINAKALAEGKALKNDTLLSLLYSARGVLFKNAGNFDSSSYFTLAALQLREEIGDEKEIAKSLNNLGTLYFETNQLDQAKKYYKKTLALRLKLKDTLRLPLVYNNLGNVYDALNITDSAVYYYEEGLSYPQGDAYALEDIRLNLGILYSQSGDAADAILHLRQTFKMLDDPLEKALCLHNIGLSYEKLGQYDSAFYYVNRADAYADSLGFMEVKRDVARSYFILQLKVENDTAALNKWKTFDYYNALVTEQKLASNIAELDLKYQTEKKDAQLRYETERNKRMEAENEQSYTTIIALVSLLIVVVILTLLLSRFSNQKRKLARLELETKKQEIEQLIQGYELDIYEAQNFGQQAERSRIAMDLHDRLGGLLAAVNLQVERLLNTDERQDKTQLDQLKQMINDGIVEVRNISHNMRAEALKSHGLKGALEAISSSITSAKEIKIDLYLDDLLDTAGSEYEREVYKIILELFSNTLRHAQASLITLQINQIDDELTLVYEDNGLGFDTEKKSAEGLGLSSINERIKNLKGNWQIDSRLNKGTTIIINIPTS